METEMNNYLTFLNLKITKKNKKLEFGTFRKDTHADNNIKDISYNSTSHTHAIINSLAYRLVNAPHNPIEHKFKKRIKSVAYSSQGSHTNQVDSRIKLADGSMTV